MSTLEYILLYTSIGSIGGLAGGLILLAKEKIALKVSHFLAAFAAGTLLGTAFFDLLPEASEHSDTVDIFFWTLMGILLFFFIERFIHWFHHHDHEHEGDTISKSTTSLIIIGDTVHNFLDGIVIGATFLAGVPLGVITTLAIFAHEIPQEIGDFGVLLHKGMSRKRIIIINVVSALASFVGAILAFYLGESIEGSLPIFLSVTAGFFIYIATSDLIPEIHFERRRGIALIESGLLILGVAMIYLVVTLLEHPH